MPDAAVWLINILYASILQRQKDDFVSVRWQMDKASTKSVVWKASKMFYSLSLHHLTGSSSNDGD